jgi:signal-transduction protein with cAMP-binding, CBS, and nucleotidyltransferase domain
MRVSELMHTPPVICSPSTTIREAALLMGRRNVGSVIVVDEVGEVAGIVTDRDIVLRGVGRGRSADLPVDSVMTRNVATVDVHADIADAAATMMKRCVRRLPVTDEAGHAHGLIALDDLVREMGNQVDRVSELLRSQSVPAST